MPLITFHSLRCPPLPAGRRLTQAVTATGPHSNDPASNSVLLPATAASFPGSESKPAAGGALPEVGAVEPYGEAELLYDGHFALGESCWYQVQQCRA